MKELELTLLFLLRDDEILLAMKKRGFGADRYNGVGGKVEAEETIEDAMVRETLEEISVEPLEYEKVADIHFDEFFKGQPALMHVHVFTSKKWKGEPIESEEMTPKWFKRNEVPYGEMWSDDSYWLPTVLEGNKIRAQFTLDENDNITDHTITLVESLEIKKD
jgi:8-oxo-dGTP pyrophosphatase MutT (NUDIX family)